MIAAVNEKYCQSSSSWLALQAVIEPRIPPTACVSSHDPLPQISSSGYSSLPTQESSHPQRQSSTTSCLAFPTFSSFQDLLGNFIAVHSLHMSSPSDSLQLDLTISIPPYRLVNTLFLIRQIPSSKGTKKPS